MPPWTRLVVALIIVVMIFSFAHLPSSLAAGIAFARGEKAEAAGDYPKAVGYYQKAVQVYPDSHKVILRLAITQFRAGQLMPAVQTIKKLEGKELPKDMADEADGLMRQIEAAVDKMDTQR